MAKRITHKHLQAGDVFCIPLNDTARVLGQVLEPGVEQYICVFDKVFASDVDIKQVPHLKMLLVGRTTDALFYHGTWTVVGRTSTPTQYPRPNHVVNSPQGLVLRTFDDELIRPADAADKEFFGFKRNTAPIGFANAARSIFELAQAERDYSHLLPQDAWRRMQSAPPSGSHSA
jgi:hypothetical protein